MASPESPVAANHVDDAALADSMNQLNVGDRENEAPKTDEEYAQSTLTLRAIVSTKEAGVIIGKAGKNVADLREETGVKAGVSKVVQGVHDRVLTVTGPLAGIAKAYSLVAKGLLEGAPQMGMGGVVANNGTHRELFPVTDNHHDNSLTLSSHPSPDFTQPDGHHHWPTRAEDQAHSRCVQRSHGRTEGNAPPIHRAHC